MHLIRALFMLTFGLAFALLVVALLLTLWFLSLLYRLWCKLTGKNPQAEWLQAGQRVRQWQAQRMDQMRSGAGGGSRRKASTDVEDAVVKDETPRLPR
jgi:hypothetical protein